jgi:hypothetical protein
VLLHQHSKGNEIGDVGATAIANALKENKSITGLDLSSKYFLFLVLLHQHSKDNKIGDVGATTIANALKENKSITTLFLCSKYFLFLVLLHQHSKDNKIGYAGATAIANTLKENKSITTLYLSGKYFFFSLCFSTNIQQGTRSENKQNPKLGIVGRTGALPFISEIPKKEKLVSLILKIQL